MQKVKLEFATLNDYRLEESFKTLRTNIMFCSDGAKVIAVTSSTPDEGKSSVAMGMAKAFAEAGSKTVLIDADMRKSVLAERYKVGAVHMGLSNYLIGIANYSDVLCETNINNLYMMFSGFIPPNPSELLGREQFGTVLQNLRILYDYIIIDTPSLGNVIDAAVIAKSCDGIVLVVESNAVNYKFAQKIKEQLDMSGCRIIGAVMNKVDLKGNKFYGFSSGNTYIDTNW